jgi:anti-anti-sigma factor
LDAVPSLEAALDAAIRSTAGAFVLDLCDLDFLDSSGLRLILRARAR